MIVTIHNIDVEILTNSQSQFDAFVGTQKIPSESINGFPSIQNAIHETRKWIIANQIPDNYRDVINLEGKKYHDDDFPFK